MRGATDAIARAYQSSSPTWTGVVLICLLVSIMLVPFINKPFHLDDPFYIWVAQQIAEDPLDFYGFDVNWQGTPESAASVNKNPPLVSHFIAVFGSLFGWSEIVLHAAMLLPAMGLCVGTYYLASLMTQRPLLAAIIGSVTPVFCLSASNIMAETLMLCFYIWAAYYWLIGTERNRFGWLMLAALLAALSTLTKYFGVTSFLLFAAVSIYQVKRPGLWIVALIFGISIILAYERYMYLTYGQAHLFAAAEFASEFRDVVPVNGSMSQKLLIGLSFLGACVAPVLVYMPLLVTKRTAKKLAGVAGLGAVWFIFLGVDFFTLSSAVSESPSLYAVQWGIWFVAGAFTLWLAATEFRRNPSMYTLFLLFATLGAFSFSTFVNWSINGRSLILAGPVIAIVLARRVPALNPDVRGSREWRFVIPLAPVIVLSVALNWADYRLASASRRAAEYYSAVFDGSPGTVWYQGHWGFQYYMDQFGAQHFDKNQPEIESGDFMVAHVNNTETYPMHTDAVDRSHLYDVKVCRWLATWNPGVGATFYAHSVGALPFVFTAVGPESYIGWELKYSGELELSLEETEEAS
jgi:hypothetical protein